MMIARNSIFASAFVCAASCITAADAQLGWPGPALGWPTDGRPATEKDLAGKKICWDNGKISLFAANGQFTNAQGHHRSWQVTEPGVVQVGDKYTQYLVLPDGSFYNHWYHGHKSITGHAEHWGKVCS